LSKFASRQDESNSTTLTHVLVSIPRCIRMTNTDADVTTVPHSIKPTGLSAYA